MPKPKFKNSKQDKFLQDYPDPNYKDDWPTGNFSSRCKFNFSYFTQDPECGESFEDWEDSKHLAGLLSTLTELSKKSLTQLQLERVGGGRTRLASYGDFPKHSLFTKPKAVPAFAQWARIRLDQNRRLIGFLIPQELHNQPQDSSEFHLDKNTFYVVFLDKEHKFYPL